ncbi:hypothetical protein CICLE_v10023100mg [Citrus x clementina]|uniref:Uncharacterized protein n=1 Tax=Citrus clementina TaxID=85681 RepID=V4SX49_CITCL|nr:hypothetical protein CICLE_v10023100mg [Citrus x clementina]
MTNLGLMQWLNVTIENKHIELTTVYNGQIYNRQPETKTPSRSVYNDPSPHKTKTSTSEGQKLQSMNSQMHLNYDSQKQHSHFPPDY